MAVYDPEKTDSPVGTPKPGSHDDLGVHPERREAEVADLEKSFNSDTATEPLRKEASGSGGGNNLFNFRNEDKGGGLKDRLTGLPGQVSSMSNAKKFAAGGAFGAIGLVVLLVFFLLMLGSLKSIHFAMVLRSAGFARFNLQMRQRYSQDLFDAAVYTENNTGSFTLEKRTMLDRLSGSNVQKQLTDLGEKGKLKFEFEGGRDWLGRKTSTFKSITIDEGGGPVTVSLDDITAKLYGEGKTYDSLRGPFNSAKRSAVRDEFATQSRDALSNISELDARSVRSDVYDGIRQASGIKLQTWPDKAKEFFGKKPADAEKLNNKEQLAEVNSGEPVSTGQAQEDAAATEAKDTVTQQIEQNGKVDVPTVEKTVADTKLNGTELARDASGVVFLATSYCIGHSLLQSFDQINTQTFQTAQRMGHAALTTGDQVASGDTANEAVGADANNWTGSDASASYQKDIHNPDFANEVDDKAPYTGTSAITNTIAILKTIDDTVASGSAVPAAKTVLGLEFGSGASDLVQKANDDMKNAACDAFTNPDLQYSIAAAEIVFAAVTAGQEAAASEATARGVAFAVIKSLGKSAVQAGKTIAAGEIIGQLLQSAIDKFSGLQFTSASQGADRYSQAHVGVGLLQSSNIQQGLYGKPLTAVQTAQIDYDVQQAEIQKTKEMGWTQRYFAIDNPYSLTGRMAAVAPTSTSQIVAAIPRFMPNLASWISNGIKGLVFGTGFGKKVAFAETSNDFDDLTNGVLQNGYSEDEVKLMADDESYNVLNNAKIVEADAGGVYTDFGNKFGHCFTDTIDKIENQAVDAHLSLYSTSKIDPQPTQSGVCTNGNLSGEVALRYRIYHGMDNYAVNMLTDDLGHPTDGTTAAQPTSGSSSGFIWPMDGNNTITQCFTWDGRSGHPGLDISTARGTPIKAVADGVVSLAGPVTGYGPNFVAITHANGFGTSYGHMDSMTVKTGDKVTQGQVIGTEGSQGQSSGPHLHFNLFHGAYSGSDGPNIDPLVNGFSIPAGVSNPHNCQ